MSLAAAAAPHATRLYVLPLFAATLFSSATLLFFVQPMFTKMVLPLLGGTPGVWNTAMMFFQAALLAGYAYAHVVARHLPPLAQVGAHLAVLALGFLFLPVAVAAGWTPPPDSSPIPWLVALLAVSVGLPFFAVSATAPLLQSWFARTGHQAAADPYFLYGASNLGSLLALIAYPFVVEPLLAVPQQTLLWSAGYAVLVALIAACGLAAGSRPLPDLVAGGAEAAPSWRERTRWVLLAFAPSSLLLGVTTFVTTDVASAPLFWVVPLTLYLLSFVIVFARRPLLKHSWMLALQPFVFIPLAIFYTFGTTGRLHLVVPLHLLAFFVAAMVCHGELAARRPGPRHLTEFYLLMSFGGVLGGIFNAVVAPVAFNGVYEYPLAIVLAAALRPKSADGKLRWDIVLPLLLLGFILLPYFIGEPLAHLGLPGQIVFFAVSGVAIYAFAGRPLRFALGIGALLVITFVSAGPAVLEQTRSFFGVYRVEHDATRGLVNFVHGTTLHGGRLDDPERRLETITYYNPAGPIGDIFDKRLPPVRIGVTGLGVGTLACWTKPGDGIVFYEIDPAVLQIAKGKWFHFLDECGDNPPVILGDARLKLQEAPNATFDRIIMDAFSSDAIPVHLLTREAIQLYLQKLAPGGWIIIHISNRHLSLVSVVSALAKDAGLVAVRRVDDSTAEGVHSLKRTRSDFVVMARSPQDLEWLAHRPGWVGLDVEALADKRVWTDDYSDIVGALRWIKGGE